MISTLEIKNFKCFNRLSLPFGKLTLMTGFNGGGKSSAMQPLLLIGQTLRFASANSDFPLNGSLVRLGSGGDILPAGSSIPEVEFRVWAGPQSIGWHLVAKAGDRFLRSKPQSPAIENGEISDFLLKAISELTYLSAVREGSAEAYPIPDDDGRGFRDVGNDGRFAAYWYDRLADEEVEGAKGHPGEPATSFRKQLDAWLSDLFPGAQANVQAVSQISRMSTEFRLNEIGAWQRPANIGYGLTYTFPILVALLAAVSGQIIIIDSPEAHLHPSAQSKMGEILAHFASAGVQIVVETHSDHLLNGARLAVKKGTLPHDDFRIHFFTGANTEGHGVISPVVDSQGRVDEWPDGFFDQSEKDLSALAGWA